MRTYADKAATYALTVLRALGNVINELGPCWPDNARGSTAAGSLPMTGSTLQHARCAQQ
jgi:hypothetical protein